MTSRLELSELSKTERILWKMSYDFAIQCGKTEDEARQAGDDKITRTRKMLNEERNQKWVDVRTGKTVQYGGW